MSSNTNTHSADQRVDLGHGLEVSRLGFGGMAITHVYGETDPAQGLRTLNHARLDAAAALAEGGRNLSPDPARISSGRE